MEKRSESTVLLRIFLLLGSLTLIPQISNALPQEYGEHRDVRKVTGHNYSPERPELLAGEHIKQPVENQYPYLTYPQYSAQSIPSVYSYAHSPAVAHSPPAPASESSYKSLTNSPSQTQPSWNQPPAQAPASESSYKSPTNPSSQTQPSWNQPPAQAPASEPSYKSPTNPSSQTQPSWNQPLAQAPASEPSYKSPANPPFQTHPSWNQSPAQAPQPVAENPTAYNQAPATSFESSHYPQHQSPASPQVPYYNNGNNHSPHPPADSPRQKSKHHSPPSHTESHYHKNPHHGVPTPTPDDTAYLNSENTRLYTHPNSESRYHNNRISQPHIYNEPPQSSLYRYPSASFYRPLQPPPRNFRNFDYNPYNAPEYQQPMYPDYGDRNNDLEDGEEMLYNPVPRISRDYSDQIQQPEPAYIPYTDNHHPYRNFRQYDGENMRNDNKEQNDQKRLFLVYRAGNTRDDLSKKLFEDLSDSELESVIRQAYEIARQQQLQQRYRYEHQADPNAQEDDYIDDPSEIWALNSGMKSNDRYDLGQGNNDNNESKWITVPTTGELKEDSKNIENLKETSSVTENSKADKKEENKRAENDKAMDFVEDMELPLTPTEPSNIQKIAETTTNA